MPTTQTILDRSHSLRLIGPHRVVAQRGTLWLTCDGEAGDWVIEEGMSVTLDGSTPALVTALGEQARVCATSLPSPTLAQRVQRWWAGKPAPLIGLPA